MGGANYNSYHHYELERKTARNFRFAYASVSTYIVEWYDQNGQYRINDTPYKDVAEYLFRGLKATPGVKEARLTEIRTVEHYTEK